MAAVIVSVTAGEAIFDDQEVVTIPPTTEGNSMIVMCFVGASQTVTGVTLGGAALALERTELTRTNDVNWVVYALHDIAAGATNVTLNVSGNTNINFLIAFEVSGLDGNSYNAYARTGVTSPAGEHTFNSASDDEFIVSMLTHTTFTTITVPSGWTSLPDGSESSFEFYEWRVTGAAGSQTFGNSGVATTSSTAAAHGFSAAEEPAEGIGVFYLSV